MVENYLHHKLTPEDRTLFEAHLVDCEVCRDRVLLAEMFHVRNGLARQPAPEPQQRTEPTVEVLSPEISYSYRSYRPHRMTRMPRRARFVAALEPWQICLILTIAALLLVLIPTSYFIFGGR